jgi:hypothetical protein
MSKTVKKCYVIIEWTLTRVFVLGVLGEKGGGGKKFSEGGGGHEWGNILGGGGVHICQFFLLTKKNKNKVGKTNLYGVWVSILVVQWNLSKTDMV